MPTIAVIGGQWGDEGKGKIVDFMAQDADIVVRYAGGGNAGHSVENENGKFALRTIPCGMVNSHTRLNVIGRGCVPELGIVVRELGALEERGIDITRLRIDKAAHLVMPYHIVEDTLEEERRGGGKLGTTKNGIGPCYADKSGRDGVRAEDLLNFLKFRERFLRIWGQKMRHFLGCFDHFRVCSYDNHCDTCAIMWRRDAALGSIEEQVDYLTKKFGRLDKLICDTPPILWKALGRGQKVLLEGAQGFGLDIDHGSHPYVTSSNTGVASALNGSGLAPSDLSEIIGVFKAYVTRVGEGPFPTEMADHPARKIRELGREYGTVTGRPRRVGWFDTVSAKEVIRKNGLTGVAITRLDILDDFPLIGIGVKGKKGSRNIEWVPGWSTWDHKVSVRECRAVESLPEEAKVVCRIIACGVPIKFVSVGPAREETIVVS